VAQRQRRMEEEEENKVERGDSSKGLKVTDEAVHEALRQEKVAKKMETQGGGNARHIP